MLSSAAKGRINSNVYLYYMHLTFNDTNLLSRTNYVNNFNIQNSTDHSFILLLNAAR